MTSVWQLPALIGAILAWLNAPPVSLADAARHEAVRRALLPAASAVLTNETLPTLRPSDIAVPAPAPEDPEQDTSSPAETSPAGAKPVVAAEPAKAAPSDEAQWRTKVAGLTAELERNRTLAAALESRVAALQNDLLRRDDPVQRASLAQGLSKALAEAERLRTTLQSNQAEIDKLREDARRRGVPPGWLRP
ncbi:MAG: hypothetical protein IT184_10965 [Acidobacteria bacterium]|nr:hypothetical protein [Acidobacteriota bacterium]